jgi:hypothetical protein
MCPRGRVGAPCVNVGHTENAALADAIISAIAVTTDHGTPPPPYSAGNGTAPHPASTYCPYPAANPGGVLTEPSAVMAVADSVERGDHLGRESTYLGQHAVNKFWVGVLEGRQLRQSGEVHDLVEDEPDVLQRRGAIAHELTIPSATAANRLGRRVMYPAVP